MSRVETRVEVAAQNIANVTTPGYKRAVSFETLLTASEEQAGDDGSLSAISAQILAQVAIDAVPSQQQVTDIPDNLALAGGGFFTVRTPEGATLYTRNGQFQRNEAGHLVNTEGAVLLLSDGGDLVLKPGDHTVLSDGTVLQGGEAIGRIGVVDISDMTALTYAEDGLYTAPEGMVSLKEDALVIQGALETSNVSLGTEMMTVMAALRQAQTGQRLMTVYDELMGRAITTFGQG